MSYQFEQHFDDESLESYAFGRLAEPRSELLEEHLLICDQCRTRLDATERYVQAMARGGLHLRQQSAASGVFKHAFDWFRVPAIAWIPAAALSLCFALFLSTANLRHQPIAMTPVSASLTAERGLAQAVPANHPLTLHLDTRGLDLKSPVQITLVDALGTQIDAQTCTTVAPLDFKSAHPLQPGAYFVRILKYGSTTPAREFALDVR